MEKLERIKEAIMADPQNKNYTDKGIEPLFAAPKTARINIIGQAPGLKTQEAGLYWKTRVETVLGSGWELMKRPFYHSGLFAVIPILSDKNFICF